MTRAIDSRNAPDSLASAKQLLREIGVRPSRGKGQNFLIDQSVVQRIIEETCRTDLSTVVEIGPGLGVLTQDLAEHFERVIAVELDDQLAAYLQKRIKARNVEIIARDAMHLQLARIDPPLDSYVLSANLPYSSATAIIRRFLEDDHPPQRMVVMVQREVADRMAAGPPDMSLLSVATQLYAEPELAFVVPPDAFTPRPKVDSAVVVLDRRPEVPVATQERNRFFEIVTAAFRHKRKTLANSMAIELGNPKGEIEAWLAAADIDPGQRAQRLVLEDWIRLLGQDPGYT